MLDSEQGWGGAGPTFGQREFEGAICCARTALTHRAVLSRCADGFGFRRAPAASWAQSDEKGEVSLLLSWSDAESPTEQIVLVASVCMVCFTVRSVLLPILSEWFGGNLDWYTILLYFELSEVRLHLLRLPSLHPLPLRADHSDDVHAGDL